MEREFKCGHENTPDNRNYKDKAHTKYECRTCHKNYERARYKRSKKGTVSKTGGNANFQCGHPRTEENTRTGGGGCRRCNNVKVRERGRLKRRKIWETLSPEERAIREAISAKTLNKNLAEPLSVTDGWEDEFGPVPETVPAEDWYDWVAVWRAHRGYPVGRNLTPAEAIMLNWIGE